MKRIMCIGTLIVDIINSKVERLPDEGGSVAILVSVNPGGNACSTIVKLAAIG